MLLKERVSQPLLSILLNRVLLLLAVLVYLINVEVFLNYIAILLLN